MRKDHFLYPLEINWTLHSNSKIVLHKKNFYIEIYLHFSLVSRSGCRYNSQENSDKLKVKQSQERFKVVKIYENPMLKHKKNAKKL
jgi:hypothetical protein